MENLIKMDDLGAPLFLETPKWLLLHKTAFFGGFRQLCFTFTSQSPPGFKVEMSQPYKSSPQKTTHHVVAVGETQNFILQIPKGMGWRMSFRLQMWRHVGHVEFQGDMYNGGIS